MINDCGISKYIGLPEKPNVENFIKICENAKKNNLVLAPATRLAALLKTTDQALQLNERLKFSAFDRDLIVWIINYRELVSDDKQLKRYQYLIVHCKEVRVSRQYTEELLRYKGYTEVLKQFQKWEMPRFPVNGNMVKPFIKKAAMTGLIITKLKNIWLDHDFQLTADELCAHIPDTIAEIEQKGLMQKKFKNK